MRTPAGAKRLLAETGRDARQALEETRRLAHAIYPPLLEAGGLGIALRSAATDANVPVRIDVAPGAAYPPEIAGAVYFSCVAVFERVQAGTPVTIGSATRPGHSPSASRRMASWMRNGYPSAIGSRRSAGD